MPMAAPKPQKVSAADHAANRAMIEARQIGLNLGDQWAIDAARQASKMFGNQALMPMGAILASAHPFALDYVKQAPVLVLAVMGGQSRINARKRQFVLSQWATICKDGRPLPEVMRLFKLPVQLRALTAGYLAPSHWTTITYLAKLDPSTLAQIIPAKYQHSWLRACDAWIGTMQRRATSIDKTGRVLLLNWLGQHWQDDNANLKAPPNAASDMADFAFARRDHFNPKWTWQQAQAAMERWHIDLAKLKVGDAEVETKPFPREAEVSGYTFIALNNPAELVAEGMAMHHCVGSYTDQLVKGYSRIISVRRNGKRSGTAEFSQQMVQHSRLDENSFRPIEDTKLVWKLVQHRGQCNVQPPLAERNALADYIKFVKDSAKLDKRDVAA